MHIYDNSTAVVVGTDHQNTLGVIRSLGEARFNIKAVIISADSKCLTAQSKYIKECFVVHVEEVIPTLLKIADGLGYRVPLIPCGDDTMIPVSKEYNLLKDLYYLPSAVNGENTLRLMKKTKMLEVARDAGLRVPEWVTLHEDEFPFLEMHCEKLHFPCIVKPVDLKSGGYFKFHILQSSKELSSIKEYITTNCQSVIIQEYVNKTAEYGINACRLHHSGETIFCGVIEKERFSQLSLGSTTAGKVCEDHYGLCEQAQKFVESIDYRGIFDMEFITDGMNFYFVEMNFRNGGYGYACTKAGRNLPAIWVSEAFGRNIDQYVSEPIANIFFINESADIQNVRIGNCKAFTWFKDILRAKAHMYINIRDMKPLLKKVLR